MNFDEYLLPQYPVIGIPVSELIAALKVVADAVPLPPHSEEARVLQLDSRREGYLHVQTGIRSGVRAGGGKTILLKRTSGGWRGVN